MFEKVSKNHPDKIMDRIAGAIVDYAYTQESDPRIAVEGIIGHGKCHIIAETSVEIPYEVVSGIVDRIAGEGFEVIFDQVPQDAHLAENQADGIRCGDNGIFKGAQVTEEQIVLSKFARSMDERFGSDGKYILDEGHLIVCQSNATEEEIKEVIDEYGFTDYVINPLGEWTGGLDVDCGAINRKLGSDMADSVTGGGVHGKDHSKADVSVNIFGFIMSQKYERPFETYCAIGSSEVGGVPYEGIVRIARQYIEGLGGFEKFAEYGFLR